MDLIIYPRSHILTIEELEFELKPIYLIVGSVLLSLYHTAFLRAAFQKGCPACSLGSDWLHLNYYSQ